MAKEIEEPKNVSVTPSASKNLSTASMEIKFIEGPKWTGFKFITKKKGAYGPTKDECNEYNYREQLVTDVLITITAPHGRYSWKDHCVNPIFEVLKDGFQTLTIPFTSIYKIEIVAPGTSKQPGDRIIGKFDLEMGQKITAAIGQPQLFGFNDEGGSGGSFLVLKTNKEQKVLLAAGVSAHTGNIQDYLKTIKEYYNWGVGGGFGGFLEGTAAGRDGIFRGSFSADPNAKFDKHYVEYGYCKIEKVDE